ncbi:MAG: biopolymer transporter ExbD [Oceanicaulis sp.]
MRRRARRGSDQADVNMTPMLDIVFILLIFFIVTATFLQEEGLDLRPPPPSEEPPEESNPVILVQITNQNRVFVNQDATSELRVLSAVSRIRAEQPNSAVLIEVAQDAEHGTMVRLVDELRANSIPVSISRANEE